MVVSGGVVATGGCVGCDGFVPDDGDGGTVDGVRRV